MSRARTPLQLVFSSIDSFMSQGPRMSSDIQPGVVCNIGTGINRSIRVEYHFLLSSAGENTWDDIFMVSFNTSTAGDKSGKVKMNLIRC